MATIYLYKYISGGVQSSELDFGQLIEDNPTNPLLVGKDPLSVDDFVAYVEGALPDGLGITIDTLDGVKAVYQNIDLSSGSDTGLTANTIPVWNGTTLVDSSMSEETGRIESSKSIGVPSASIIIGQNTTISGGGRKVNFDNLAFDISSIINPTEYDAAGGTQTAIDIKAESSIDSQLDDSVNGASSGSFSRIMDNNQILSKITVQGHVASTTGIFTIKVTDISGAIIFNQEDIVLLDTGTTEIVFTNPLALKSGDIIFVEYDNLSLKGSTGTFVPYFVVTGHLFSEIIASQQLSTSLLSGGVISLNSPTSIDVALGAGYKVIQNANGIPTIFDVSWDALTNVTITDILTQASTRIGMDFNGDIVQIPFDLTPFDLRAYVILGYVIHPSGTITDVVNDSLKNQELYSQFLDLLEVNGVTRKVGLAVTPNALLTIDKSSGVLQAPGAGIASGNDGQNIIDINAQSPASFSRLLGITTTEETLSTNDIDPGFYDDGTATKAAVTNNDATIQYIYQFADNPNGGLIVMYGQTVYTSLDDAVINSQYDIVLIPQEIENRANLICRIALDNRCTDLTDQDFAVFLDGVKFGVATGGLGLPFGASPTGGDVFGPASSTVDEIATYSDTSGKVIKSQSDIIALNSELQTTTLNGDLKLKQKGSGRIEIEGDSGIGELDINAVNPVSDSILGLSSAGTRVASLSYDKSLTAYVIQSGAGIGVPADTSIPYMAHFLNQRFEIGTSRFEQRTESELSNMQYLMVTDNINRGGFSYIQTTNSFNVRVGANPDPTGFDIQVPQTVFNHSLTPKSYTETERDLIDTTDIDNGAIIYNSTSGKLQVLNGTDWVDLSNRTTVSGKLNNQTPTVTGTSGSVTTGTFQYYDIDGIAETPVITNGVWTVDVTGKYQFNFRCYPIEETPSTNAAQFWISINDEDPIDDKNAIFDYKGRNENQVWLSAVLDLTAGDEVKIKYQLGSTNNWDLEDLTWDFHKIN